MKIKIGDEILFNCPFAIKEGVVVDIIKDEYHVKTPISIWVIKIDKIIEKIEK